MPFNCLYILLNVIFATSDEASELLTLFLSFGLFLNVTRLICVEILSGITMFYFNFPFGSQTVHIVIATIIFGLQLYLLLENSKKNTK